MKKRYVTLSFLAFFQNAYVMADFIGISNEEFIQHYTPQHDPLWCWAASTQMVLSYQGVKVPQEQIVLRVKGALYSNTGSITDMINAANGLFEVDGSNTVVSGQYIHGAPLATVLYNQLSHKRPIILNYIQQGSNIGHAIVVTGIEASIKSQQLLVSKIYIFDPFAYNSMPDMYGSYRYVFDKNLITKNYDLFTMNDGIHINPGVITGVILVDGTKL